MSTHNQSNAVPFKAYSVTIRKGELHISFVWQDHNFVFANQSRTDQSLATPLYYPVSYAREVTIEVGIE